MFLKKSHVYRRFVLVQMAERILGAVVVRVVVPPYVRNISWETIYKQIQNTESETQPRLITVWLEHSKKKRERA